MTWWNDLINYFEHIGRYHRVNPLIYAGIHLVGTPLFTASIGWILYNKRKRKPLVVPVCLAIVLFNLSNFYLIIFGKHIPSWIYALAAGTSLFGGWLAYKRIRKRINEHTGGHPSN